MTEVTNDVQQDIENIKSQVWFAYNMRQKIDQRGTARETSYIKNEVTIDNPHLYPILVSEAFKKIGMKGRELQKTVEEFVGHELSHSAPVATGTNAKYSVQFYELKGLPFFAARKVISASTKLKDNFSPAEMLDVAINPEELSRDDIVDIKNIVQQIRSDPKTTIKERKLLDKLIDEAIKKQEK